MSKLDSLRPELRPSVLDWAGPRAAKNLSGASRLWRSVVDAYSISLGYGALLAAMAEWTMVDIVTEPLPRANLDVAEACVRRVRERLCRCGVPAEEPDDDTPQRRGASLVRFLYPAAAQLAGVWALFALEWCARVERRYLAGEEPAPRAPLLAMVRYRGAALTAALERDTPAERIPKLKGFIDIMRRQAKPSDDSAARKNRDLLSNVHSLVGEYYRSGFPAPDNVAIDCIRMVAITAERFRDMSGMNTGLSVVANELRHYSDWCRRLGNPDQIREMLRAERKARMPDFIIMPSLLSQRCTMQEFHDTLFSPTVRVPSLQSVFLADVPGPVPAWPRIDHNIDTDDDTN